MCIIAWNWEPQSSSPFTLIGNRDELYSRPTLPLHWWTNEKILAGKDLQAGGTWLAVNQKGFLAALTNYRDGQSTVNFTSSRGDIIKTFLNSNLKPLNFLESLQNTSQLYNNFNLLIYDLENLFGYESRTKKIIKLQPGFGVVSNGDFFSNWPKCSTLLRYIQEYCTQNNNEYYLSKLEDNNTFADNLLPNTGMGIDIERLLSSIFIKSPNYGTVSSSIVKFNNASLCFIEKSFSNGFTSRKITKKLLF